MTKKDYEQIATVLWLTKPKNHGQDPNGIWRATVSVMGTVLAGNDPKFKIVNFNGICHGGKNWCNHEHTAPAHDPDMRRCLTCDKLIPTVKD